MWGRRPKVKPPQGAVHEARRDLVEARARLEAAIRRSREVDSLAREISRALHIRPEGR